MKHSPRFLDLVSKARARVTEVSIDDFRQQVDAPGGQPVLLDVREDHEWAKGHLPGAEHLGRGILERDVENAYPDLDTDLVLYCGGGYRSALAADSLSQMGYRRVRSLAGGYRAWTEAGLPIVTS